MMDRSDKHFRFLTRVLAPNALLYTEMITARALLRGDARACCASMPRSIRSRSS